MVLFTSPHDAVLADLASVYVAQPGTPLYDAPYLMCGRPLHSRPFTIYVVVTQGVCPSGFAHMPADATMIHNDCAPASPDDLYRAMLAVLDHDNAA